MKRKYTVTAAVVVALAVILIISRPRPAVVLIQDPVFEQTYPEYAIRDFEKALGRQGYDLKVVTADSGTIRSDAALSALVKKHSGSKLVLFSPMVTSSVLAHGIDAAGICSCLTVGIGAGGNDLIDMILVTDLQSMSESEGKDYRFTLGADDYTTVIYPDFVLSVIPLLQLEKETNTVHEGVLVYDAR